METEKQRPLFPWYKERLQTKYLKAPGNKTPLVGSSCRFGTVSLDDLSDGSSVLSGHQRGVPSVIFHETLSNSNSSQKHKKSISKERACFSKQMIQKQIRRDYVAAVEEKLKQHPLATFPHYKDHMTPELFEKVVSVLDPDMGVNSASALPTPTGDHVKEDEMEKGTEPSKEEVDRASDDKIPDVQNPSPRNPYILQMNGNVIKKGQTVRANLPRTHKDMKEAAKLFSMWFALPEEKSNVSESAIPGLQHSSSHCFKVQVEDTRSFSGQES